METVLHHPLSATASIQCDLIDLDTAFLYYASARREGLISWSETKRGIMRLVKVGTDRVKSHIKLTFPQMAITEIRLALFTDIPLDIHTATVYNWLMDAEERRPAFTCLVENGILNGVPCRTNMDEFALVNNSSGLYDKIIAKTEMDRTGKSKMIKTPTARKLNYP